MRSKLATKGQVERSYPTNDGAQAFIITWLDGSGPNPVHSTEAFKQGQRVYLAASGRVSANRVQQ